jgi:hypothetical protein
MLEGNRLVRHLLISALLTLPLLSGASFAKEPSSDALIRTSQWDLSYDNNSCDLAAEFGSGEKKTILMISRNSPSDHFNITLAGKHLKYSLQTSTAEVNFLPGDSSLDATALHGTLGNMPMAFISGLRIDDRRIKFGHDAPPITPEQEAAVNKVIIKVSGQTTALQIGPMAPLFSAMRKCTDDLVKGWGLDPAQQAALSRPARPVTDPRYWFESEDYPLEKLIQGSGSYIQFRLDIDARGKITACKVTSAVSKADFDKVTCNLITSRGRFEPALDAEGKAIRSYYTTSVIWRIR